MVLPIQKYKAVPVPNKTKIQRPRGSGPVQSKLKVGENRAVGQREYDRAELAKWMRRGATQAWIAERLGVSTQTIHLDWRILVTQMRQFRDTDVEAAIAIKLEEYAEIKREAWEAWEKSKVEWHKTVEDSYTRADGSPGGKITTTTEDCVGDSRFLQIIMSCLAAERELQALDPPKVVQGHLSGSITWDILLGAIPSGPVPDEVEAAIARELGMASMPGTGG
jgi:hypothetical protein